MLLADLRMKKGMSILVLLTQLPVPVLFAIVGCIFLLLLFLLLIVAFIPAATGRIVRIIEAFQRPYYDKQGSYRRRCSRRGCQKNK
jgi:hypothetical protein